MKTATKEIDTDILLEKENVDLILLDLMMPGVKGAEVAKIIKEK